MLLQMYELRQTRAIVRNKNGTLLEDFEDLAGNSGAGGLSQKKPMLIVRHSLSQVIWDMSPSFFAPFRGICYCIFVVLLSKFVVACPGYGGKGCTSYSENPDL